MRLPVMILILVLLAGCSHTAPEPVSYNAQIQPILTARCTSCHGAEKAEGKVLLTSYEALMASRIMPGKKPLVTPGEHLKSWLYILCATDQPHYRMPPDTTDLTLVPKTELALIADWIAQGAKNN